MSDSKEQPLENSFSTFMFGLTVGIVGSLLLGTEEGRRVTRRMLSSISSNLENNEDLFQDAKNIASQAVREIKNQFSEEQSYLSDHPRQEPPPPPPPFTNRPRSVPTFFHSNGNPLDS